MFRNHNKLALDKNWSEQSSKERMHQSDTSSKNRGNMNETSEWSGGCLEDFLDALEVIKNAAAGTWATRVSNYPCKYYSLYEKASC